MWLLRTRSLLVCQLVAVAAAFAMFGFWPPASGQMLLLPVDGSNRSEVARIALSGGAALLRPGMFPRSMVVSGDRAAISAQLRGRAILLLAATGVTCGRGIRGA